MSPHEAALMRAGSVDGLLEVDEVHAITLDRELGAEDVDLLGRGSVLGDKGLEHSTDALDERLTVRDRPLDGRPRGDVEQTDHLDHHHPAGAQHALVGRDEVAGEVVRIETELLVGSRRLHESLLELVEHSSLV